MRSAPHNKIIAEVAKRRLGPRGYVRIGQSRRWWKDFGIWGMHVEFQSSAWSRGSYLNVGCSFLVMPEAINTFQVGSRERVNIDGKSVEFVEYTSDPAFASALDVMCDAILASEARWRSSFRSLDAITSFATREWAQKGRLNQDLEIVLMLLDGNVGNLELHPAVKKQFDDLYADAMQDALRLKACILDVVNGNRAWLKLAPLTELAVLNPPS